MPSFRISDRRTRKSSKTLGKSRKQSFAFYLKWKYVEAEVEEEEEEEVVEEEEEKINCRRVRDPFSFR